RLLSSFYTLSLYNHTAPTKFYTLSLHDALPISRSEQRLIAPGCKTFSTNPADLIFYCPQRSMGKRSPSRCHVEFECNTASARRSLRRVKARWATLRKHLTAQFFLKRRVR